MSTKTESPFFHTSKTEKYFYFINLLVEHKFTLYLNRKSKIKIHGI